MVGDYILLPVTTTRVDICRQLASQHDEHG